MKMRDLGYVLFVAGMMLAVLFAAKPVDSETAPPVDGSVSAKQFPDTWPVCALGLVGGAIGAGLIRRGRVTEMAAGISKDQHVLGSQPLDAPSDRLLAIAKSIDEIKASREDWASDALRQSIDRVLVDEVTPFSSRQDELHAGLGMTRGSEVLVAVAVGERMLNRVWSTSADGYVDEARHSLHEASAAFRQAAELCHS